MSWDFNGTSGWVGNTASAPVGNGAGTTLACWARPDVLGSCLMSISDATGNSGALRIVMVGTGTRATSITTGNVSSTIDTTTGAPAVGVWGHYAATFTNAARSAFFNGANKATVTATNSATGFTRTQIGARRVGSTIDAFFNGRIAEVGVWNTTLTDAEIASLGAGVSCSLVRPQNLVLYAPMIRELKDFSRTLFSFGNIATGAAVDTGGFHPGVYL